MGELETKACIACKTALPDRSENPNSELCPQCRERYIKYPFPKWLWYMLAGILLINIVSYYWFPQTMKDYAAAKQADRLFQQAHYLLAAKQYQSLAGKYGSSSHYMESQLDAWMYAGDFEHADALIQKNYVGKDVDDRLYSKLTGYDTTLGNYSKAYEAIDEVAKQGLDVAGSLAALEKLRGTAETDPIILEQIAVLNSTLHNDSLALSQIDEAIAKGDRYLAAEATKAQILRRAKDYAAAEQAARKALESNQDDVNAHRQLAVLGILKKDYTTAIAEAKTAYELDKFYPYAGETLAIAYHLAGDTANRDSILAEMKANVVAVDGDLKKLMAGEMTAEDIYLK